MTKIVQNLKWAAILGFVIWIVGFILGMVVFSLGLMDKIHLIEAVIMAPLGIVLGIFYFSRMSKKRTWDGFKVGIIWLLMNLSLDLIVLVGMFGTPLEEYLRTVAVSYLFMPLVMIALGFILDKMRPRG